MRFDFITRVSKLLLQNNGMNQRFVLHMVWRQAGQQQSSQQQNMWQIKDV